MKTMSIMLAALAVCACKSSMGRVDVRSRAVAQNAEVAPRESVVDLSDRCSLARETDGVIPKGLARTTLERVPVRSPGSRTTLSAWRLEASSDHGSGAILFIDLPPQAPYYVGEGVFFGWPPKKLASIYRDLAPVEVEAEIDFPPQG